MDTFTPYDLKTILHSKRANLYSATRGDTEQEFRQACIEILTRSEALDFMIDTIKEVAQLMGQLAQREGL